MLILAQDGARQSFTRLSDTAISGIHNDVVDVAVIWLLKDPSDYVRLLSDEIIMKLKYDVYVVVDSNEVYWQKSYDELAAWHPTDVVPATGPKLRFVQYDDASLRRNNYYGTVRGSKASSEPTSRDKALFLVLTDTHEHMWTRYRFVWMLEADVAIGNAFTLANLTNISLNRGVQYVSPSIHTTNDNWVHWRTRQYRGDQNFDEATELWHSMVCAVGMAPSAYRTAFQSLLNGTGRLMDEVLLPTVAKAMNLTIWHPRQLDTIKWRHHKQRSWTVEDASSAAPHPAQQLFHPVTNLSVALQLHHEFVGHLTEAMVTPRL